MLVFPADEQGVLVLGRGGAGGDVDDLKGHAGRGGRGSQRFRGRAVVEAQQKIADTFSDLKLIPKRLSIKDVIWTPPAAAKVAQQ